MPSQLPACCSPCCSKKRDTNRGQGPCCQPASRALGSTQCLHHRLWPRRCSSTLSSPSRAHVGLLAPGRPTPVPHVLLAALAPHSPKGESCSRVVPCFFVSSEPGRNPRLFNPFWIQRRNTGAETNPIITGTVWPRPCHRASRCHGAGDVSRRAAHSANSPSSGTFISRFLTVKVNEPHIKDQLHIKPTQSQPLRGRCSFSEAITYLQTRASYAN